MPKFAILIDENISVKTADFLLRAGHNVKLAVKDLKGAKDKDILRIAFEEKRFVVTLDKDFCDLVFRDSLPCHGIILLRLNDESPLAINKVLATFFENNKEDLQGQFVVLTETTARIRKI